MLLLRLLLHPLNLRPDDIPSLALHLDRLALVRVVELEQALDPADVGQSSPQQLQRASLLLLTLSLLALLSLLLALLLLALLLLVLLLLVVLRHAFLPTAWSQLGRSSSSPPGVHPGILVPHAYRS